MTPGLVDVKPLVLLDKRIDENESDALRARWEFGREPVALLVKATKREDVDRG